VSQQHLQSLEGLVGKAVLVKVRVNVKMRVRIGEAVSGQFRSGRLAPKSKLEVRYNLRS